MTRHHQFRHRVQHWLMVSQRKGANAVTEQRQTGAAGFSQQQWICIPAYIWQALFLFVFLFHRSFPLSGNSGTVNTMYAYHPSLIGQCPHPSTNPSLTPAGNHSNSVSASWCCTLPVDSHLKLIFLVLTLESEEIN